VTILLVIIACVDSSGPTADHYPAASSPTRYLLRRLRVIGASADRLGRGRGA
jgi:hypothetical protein